MDGPHFGDPRQLRIAADAARSPSASQTATPRVAKAQVVEIVYYSLKVALILFLAESTTSALLVVTGNSSSEVTWLSWERSLWTALVVGFGVSVPAVLMWLALGHPRQEYPFKHTVLCSMLLTYALVLHVPLSLAAVGVVIMLAEYFWPRLDLEGQQALAIGAELYYVSGLIICSLYTLVQYHLASQVEGQSGIRIDAVGTLSAVLLALIVMIMRRASSRARLTIGQRLLMTRVTVGLVLLLYGVVTFRAHVLSEPATGHYSDVGSGVYDGPQDDLVLLIVDTLRADRLGVYSGVALTPHLDAFAAHAVVYADHVAAAPWTAPSVASLLTGYSPTVTGVHLPRWSRDTLDLRPGRLRRC